MYFYGDICSSTWDLWQREDMCPQDVADFLNGLTGEKNINIYINSGGGDSFAGLAIFNQLRRNGAHLDVYDDGIAASAAGLIALLGCLPGNTLHMSPGAEYMMHKCWTISLGNANDFRTVADALDKCDASYMEIFVSVAADGVTEDQLAEMQTAETWKNGTELAKIFKNVQVDGEQIAASLDPVFLGRYKNVPKSLVKEEKPFSIHDGVVPPNISTDIAPDDVTWSKPVLSDYTDKQWSDLTDKEKRDIAGHYAWAAEMPPDTFGDMKFPHHDPKAHKVVLAGLSAAAARIDAADIPEADISKVKDHMTQHYHDFGKKAPWEQDDSDSSAEAEAKEKAMVTARAILAMSK